MTSIKNYLGYLVSTSIFIWVVYSLYSAAVLGSIVGLKGRIFTFTDDPVFFLFTLFLYIVFFALYGVSIANLVNKKMKKYGGNYNLNTLRAMIRHAAKNRT
jgi:ABC-type multidrug transport system permease subunit